MQINYIILDLDFLNYILLKLPRPMQQEASVVPLKTRRLPPLANRHRRLPAPPAKDFEAIIAVAAASSAPQAKI
jgi:hypothetical protein